MKIGIIGPTDLKTWKEIIDIDNDLLNHKLNDIISEMIALDHKIIIVPQKDTLPGLISKIYKDKGGKKIYGVIPMDDTEFGTKLLNEDLCDEIINCATWRNQPESLCENSDLIIAFGLSEGTTIEICQNKWFGKNKILIIQDFISNKLPKECTKNLNIKYIPYDEIQQHILEKKEKDNKPLI